MTYNELRTALKSFRDQGFDLTVKLNAKKDILQAEYDRLIALQATIEAEREPEEIELLEEMETDNKSDTISDNHESPVFEHRPKPVQVGYSPRLPKRGKRKGLIHSMVHLTVCTGFVIARSLLGDDRPKVPIVRMAGSYIPAIA